MKLADFIPPVVSQGFRSLVQRSFAAVGVAGWLRGDDSGVGPAASLNRPYAQSAWVHAAINFITGEISTRPLKFYQGDKEYTDPAFVAWWEKPALGPKVAGGIQPRLDRADVQRDLAAWAKLEGEFFLLFDDSWVIASVRRNPAALTPFIVAHPLRMSVIVQGGELQGWEYLDAGGRRSVYLPDQVIHWKAFNPYDDWRGLGDLEAAFVAAQGAFYTGVYIKELMRNNGDTGFIVVGKNGVADDKQKEQIQAALRHKRAALQAGRPVDLFLSGGDMTVERPKEEAAGAEVIGNAQLSHTEIFVAFQVPPSMATIKQAYSTGKQSDRYQLISGTCMPLGGGIAGAFATAGSRMTGTALTAELDWDDHPVMVEVREARMDLALKLWDKGWSWKRINDYLDLGMQAFPGWDIAYLPFAVAPVDLSAEKPERDPAKDPALAEEEAKRKGSDDATVLQLRLLLATRTRQRAAEMAQRQVENDTLALFTCNCGRGCIAQKAERPPSEIAQWRSLVAPRRETMKAFEAAYTRVLMQARIEVLRKIEGAEGKAVLAKIAKGPIDPNVTIKTVAADLMFDLEKFTASMRDALGKQEKAGLQKAGDQLYKELAKEDPYTMAPAKVLEYLRARANKLRDVPQSVYDQVKASLEEGLQAGESMDDLAARAKAEFTDMSNTDARRVALSETAAVYGAGRQDAMEQAGVPFKMWLTSGNANVRQAHADANKQTVPIDQPFIVDGEELMAPGDEAGSAGNTINCHCVSIAKASAE